MAAVNPSIRFPMTRPELPSISEWAPIAEAAYRANWFTNFGALSRQLEAELAAAWGFGNTTCVLASSGTAAIAAPLIARGVTGKVLLPAFTFAATLSAVKMAHAEPVLIDVAAEDWRVAAGALEDALQRTGAQAAIVLCPFGMKTDFTEHARIAEAAGATLIIDNAAGLGVTRQNVEASPNVFEAYSLHATKPFGIGEGGAVFARSDTDAGLRSALNFALPTLESEAGPFWGINGKLSEFHAAIGLAVASSFGARLSRRRALARRYAEALSLFPGIEYCAAAEASAWQLFPALMPTEAIASAFVAKAAQSGMEVRRYYRPSLSAVRGIDRIGACAVSEDLAQRMCCIPVYSLAEGDEADEMVEIVAAALCSALGPRT